MSKKQQSLFSFFSPKPKPESQSALKEKSRNQKKPREEEKKIKAEFDQSGASKRSKLDDSFLKADSNGNTLDKGTSHVPNNNSKEEIENIKIKIKSRKKENIKVEEEEDEDGSDELDSPVKSPKKKSRGGRPLKKRRRIIVSESEEEDSSDEFKVKPGMEISSSSEGSDHSSGDEELDSPKSDGEDSPVKKPTKRKHSTADKTKKFSAIKQFRMPSAVDESPSPKKTRPSPNCSDTPKSQNKPKMFSPSPTVNKVTKSKLAAFSKPTTDTDQPASIEGQVYSHLTFDFLKPENIRDKNKKRPDEEGYDCHTLFISKEFIKSQTPAHKQWWTMKENHFDTVLFFKVGKFYELFHMDAVVAVKELGLIYMKGNYAHSGFPEIAYGRYADILVQRGYKVGRVEQTETPDMMNERIKQTSAKVDKVVRREMCRITTKGTRTCSFIDGATLGAENGFLLAVSERESQGETQIGVCFVDTSIGKFKLGQFTDDRHCSRFRTLIAHYNPVQILYERGRLSTSTYQLITNTLPTVVKEALAPGKDFWESSKTLKMLSESGYFSESESKQFVWPETLKSMLSDSDSLGLTAADNKQLAISALGAVTWYLSDCLLDHELLSMKQFEIYIPVDSDTKIEEKDRSADFMDRANMVLDGVTLTNLELVSNATTGTDEGTLLARLDTCSTPFGKRLFRQWLCAPLCNPGAIEQRLDAVEDLINCYDLVSEAKESIRKLPDLERLLSKIHTMGSATRSQSHPDARAIFYEDVVYSKRKIGDFLDTLSGFKRALDVVGKFQSAAVDWKSDLLKQTVGLPGLGQFPDISKLLKYLSSSFDHELAKKEGRIIPSEGVDDKYDSAMEEISACVKRFDEYLKEQKNELGIKSIVYWGTGRNRYQLEIPEAVAKRVPNNYSLKSSKKGYKRYWSEEIEDMFADLTAAEDRKDAALRDVMRVIFHTFDESYKTWERCVQCMSVLDVLMCMAEYSRCGDGVICRPQIVSPTSTDDGTSTRPFLDIRGGRHPCITRTFSGGDFIPNDVVIGCRSDNVGSGDGCHSNGSVAMITGPNMGGKSTLMRQAGLIVVLAQMGCYVPCESCSLSPVDRIFTRVGASDRIMAGESTFYLELSETAAILQHASKHSLILMDELGRGTATYDGTAIASAVVREISENISCRTLFSTHYHSLTEDFSDDPNIRLGHMACMVENEDEDPSQETITFLYKYIAGACPKSYGFNAARLADLPDDVIRTAHKKARDFEESLEKLKLFRALQNATTGSVVADIVKAKEREGTRPN